MGVLIGFLIKIVTCPGVLLNIWVTRLTCKMLGIKITKVDWRYFLIGTVVQIEPPENYFRLFAIIILPFIFMSTVALPFCYLTILGHTGIGMFFFLWLSISMAANSFPEIDLGDILWKQSRKKMKEKNYIAYLGFPIVIIIYVMMVLRLLYIDILYGGFLFFLVNKICF